MFPTEQRTKELRERFGVSNGQFWGYYRFKNLNWYLSQDDAFMTTERDEWFCFGDIRDDDPARLMALLEPNEALVLGWKDMGPDVKKDDFFNDGGGVWIIIKKDGVLFDCRRDHPQKFEGI